MDKKGLKIDVSSSGSITMACDFCGDITTTFNVFNGNFKNLTREEKLKIKKLMVEYGNLHAGCMKEQVH